MSVRDTLIVELDRIRDGAIATSKWHSLHCITSYCFTIATHILNFHPRVPIAWAGASVAFLGLGVAANSAARAIATEIATVKTQAASLPDVDIDVATDSIRRATSIRAARCWPF
jgi:hypothetical protein